MTSTSTESRHTTHRSAFIYQPASALPGAASSPTAASVIPDPLLCVIPDRGSNVIPDLFGDPIAQRDARACSFLTQYFIAGPAKRKKGCLHPFREANSAEIDEKSCTKRMTRSVFPFRAVFFEKTAESASRAGRMPCIIRFAPGAARRFQMESCSRYQLCKA